MKPTEVKRDSGTDSEDVPQFAATVASVVSILGVFVLYRTFEIFTNVCHLVVFVFVILGLAFLSDLTKRRSRGISVYMFVRINAGG